MATAACLPAGFCCCWLQSAAAGRVSFICDPDKTSKKVRLAASPLGASSYGFSEFSNLCSCFCCPAGRRQHAASVDRPRCQPGLRKKAHLCLYAAVRISAGRQARARSTSSPGEPAAVWRSTKIRAIAQTTAASTWPSAEFVDYRAPVDMALRLLDDMQVKQFIATGCLELRITELSPAFHERLYETCCERDAAAGAADAALAAQARREVFVDIPELSQVVEGPTLAGALTSLLGRGYLQHPHRTMHTRPEGSSDQAWHKDGHHIPQRHHRPRWLIGFYFPGRTTADMGATGVMEGSYCWTVDRTDARFDNIGDRLEDHNLALSGEERVLAQLHNQRAHSSSLGGSSIRCADAELRRVEAVAEQSLGVSRTRQVDCPGGTVLLMHYGTTHRAARRLLGTRPRPMFKLQFARLEQPSVTWAHDEAITASTELDPFGGVVGSCAEQREVWASIWRWMHGHSHGGGTNAAAAAATGIAAAPASGALVSRPPGQPPLQQATEVQLVGAMYRLGNSVHAADDRRALAELMAALLSPRREIGRRAAMYGLGAAGSAAVEGLLRTLTGLLSSSGEPPGRRLGCAEGRSLSAACVHALAEAMSAAPGTGREGGQAQAQPLLVEAVAVLHATLQLQLLDLRLQVERLVQAGAGHHDGTPIRTGVGDGSSSRKTWQGKTLRGGGAAPSNDPAASAAVRATAATVHALGVLGECATAGGGVPAARQAVLAALLPVTMEPDPCQQ
jgi:hypothetical protein